MCQALCQGLVTGAGAGVSGRFLLILPTLGELGASLGPRTKGARAVDGALQTGFLQPTSPKDHAMSAQQRELDSHRMSSKQHLVKRLTYSPAPAG